MLKCLECGKEHYNEFKLKCGCGGILEFRNRYQRKYKDILNPQNLDGTRYSGFIPIKKELLPDLVPPITPIMRKKINGVETIFKLEYLMPSASFKDRGTYVTIGKLKDSKINQVSLDSSGNAAISLALYGKSENIEVNVFLPRKTSKRKKKILEILDANIHEIEGNRMKVHQEAKEFDGAEYIPHWMNPFFLEGTKISAYETVEQCGNVDSVIAPTGSGTLFVGLYKGFKELKNLGVIEGTPRMIMIESKGFEDFKNRSKEKGKLTEGIEILNPPRRDRMREVLKKTNGKSISVDDSLIKDSMDDLASHGIIVESTSASVLAGFKKLLREKSNLGEKVLIPLTGSGLI